MDNWKEALNRKFKSEATETANGAIILAPFLIIILAAIYILEISSSYGNTLLWQFILPNIPNFVKAFLSIVVFLILSRVMRMLYKKETWLTTAVNWFMQKIPIAKYFWRSRNSPEKNILEELNNAKAALVKTGPGSRKLVFILGEQKVKNEPSLIRGNQSTFPLPFSGFFDFYEGEAEAKKVATKCLKIQMIIKRLIKMAESEEMQVILETLSLLLEETNKIQQAPKEKMIRFLKTPPSELLKTFLSCGVINVDQLEFEDKKNKAQ